MKFTALLPIRDEADIVGQSLDALLTWADAIYVFDTGSIDQTWEIVLGKAARDKRIIPLRREPVFFCDTRVRAFMFDAARESMRSGDWFARVDADEFHHITPPKFVSSAIAKNEGVVFHQYYDFCLTKSEVQRWDAGEESITDRSRNIEARRRWYTVSTYAEPRLCRYRDTMKWPANCSFPINAGLVARERIPIRHYPHRDPIQLARRSKLRYFMLHDSENRQHWSRPELHHWCEGDWRAFIVSEETDDNTSGKKLDVRYWLPGTELPRVHQYNHLPPPHIRAVQRMLHSLPLQYLDRWRPSFKQSDGMQPIPPELQLRIKEALSRTSEEAEIPAEINR